MFGRVDFREDEKKKRETFLEGIWLEEGRRENDGGARVFSPRAHQKVFSPKWEENLMKKI